MLDVGAQELLLIIVVAVIVIGPKELPMALRTAGRWIGKMRRVSNHFRSGIETMIREAEMEEMEKKWQAQNQRVMEEHPAVELTAENGGGTALLAPPETPAGGDTLPAAAAPTTTQLEYSASAEAAADKAKTAKPKPKPKSRPKPKPKPAKPAKD